MSSAQIVEIFVQHIAYDARKQQEHRQSSHRLEITAALLKNIAPKLVNKKEI